MKRQGRRPWQSWAQVARKKKKKKKKKISHASFGKVVKIRRHENEKQRGKRNRGGAYASLGFKALFTWISLVMVESLN